MYPLGLKLNRVCVIARARAVCAVIKQKEERIFKKTFPLPLFLVWLLPAEGKI